MTRVSLDTQIIIAILTNNASGHRSSEEWHGIGDVYRATGARIPLRKPASSQLWLLPGEAFSLDWAGA